MTPFRVVDIQKTNLQHSVLSRKGKTPVHGSYDYIMPNELKSTQFNSISFVNCKDTPSGHKSAIRRQKLMGKEKTEIITYKDRIQKIFDVNHIKQE